MSIGRLAALGVLLSASAMAQRPAPPDPSRPALRDQSRPPLQEQARPSQLREPTWQPAPPPAVAAGQDAAPAPAVVVEPRAKWLPAGAARLQALDKVNAQTSALTVKVGDKAIFGSLTIAVKSCVIRPPDQPADAAAFVDVTDSHANTAGFTGWLLANEPSVSMMQHAIYDIRVAGCS